MKKILAATTLLYFLGVVVQVHALTIAPARNEISGKPGQTVGGELTLINEEASKTFYISTQNFEAQGESGTPSFTTSKEGLAAWIHIAPDITLTKGQEVKIPYTISIPAGADPGGYFAAIFLSTVPTTAGGSEVSVGAKIGSLVLLHVEGQIKEDAGIVEFSTSDTHRVYTSLPVSFFYRFNNNGTDRVNPQGDLVIRNTIGMKTATIPANAGEGNILPHSVRRFIVSWGDPAPTESTGFFQKAGYELKYFAFGIYHAHLALAYGTNQSDSASKTIFVFPWQLLVIILVVLFILYTLLRRGVRRYNRWIIRQARNKQ